MTNNNSPPDKKFGDEIQQEVFFAREENSNSPPRASSPPVPYAAQPPPDSENKAYVDPMVMFKGTQPMIAPITLNDGRVLEDPMVVLITEDGNPYKLAASPGNESMEEYHLNTAPIPLERISGLTDYNCGVLGKAPPLPAVLNNQSDTCRDPALYYKGTMDGNPSVPYPPGQNGHKVSDAELYKRLGMIVAKSLAVHNSQTQEYYNPNSSFVSRDTYSSPENPDTVSEKRRIHGTNSGTQQKIITADFRDLSDTLDDSEKKKLKPLHTAEEFMKMQPMMTIGEELYIYAGTHYQRQNDLDVKRLIVKHCYDDVDTVGTPKFVNDVYQSILQNPDLAKKGLEINQDIVSFRNGVLNLEDGMFYKHSPLFLNISTAECNYNPKASCPMFLNFLHQITGGEAVLAERIMQMLGYLLTTKDDAKALFVCQGLSNTGKSLFCNLVSEMINREAVSNLDVHELDEMFSVSQLYEKVICFSADMPAAPLEAKVVSKLKQLTGFDTVAANVKHKNHIQFRSYTRFVLTTNHPIYFKGNEEALLNRIVTIPFAHTILPEQQDKNLLKKLRAEKDGIAARAIEAFFRLKANNYIFPGEYRLNEIFLNSRNREPVYSVNSCISNFIRDNIVADPNTGVFTSKAHEAFERQYGAIPFNSFSQYYNEAVADTYTVEKMRKRMAGEKNPVSYFKGIRLMEDAETELT